MKELIRRILREETLDESGVIDSFKKFFGNKEKNPDDKSVDIYGKYYDKDINKSYELLLNKLFRKKYEWFDRIIVNELSYYKIQNYFAIDAEIFADEDWVGNQWREFHYPQPMPSGTGNEPITLPSLIGGESSKELEDDFRKVFSFVTSEITPKYATLGGVYVKPIKMNNNNLQETIRKILREEFYSPQGQEYTPDKFVVHKSNPIWRKSIKDNGL